MITPADLWQAIEHADVEWVRRCLHEHPELVESVDDWGLTPLMHAAGACTRQLAMIDAILGAGASVNRQTPEGYTAMHCAIDVNGEANRNADEVIGRLVAAGADLKFRASYGWTPLLKAIVVGTTDEVRALLSRGADPNDTLPGDTLPAFNAGRTALMAAFPTPQAEEVVEALLQAGADPMRTDLDGMTFFDYCEAQERAYSGHELASRATRCLRIARRYKLPPDNGG